MNWKIIYLHPTNTHTWRPRLKKKVKNGNDDYWTKQEPTWYSVWMMATVALNPSRRWNLKTVVPILFSSASSTAIMSLMSMSHDPQRANKLYTSAPFQGACVDSGAEVSIIAADQAKAYQIIMGSIIRLIPSPLWFKCFDYIFKSDGVTNVRVPVPDGRYISFQAHIVKADISMLIGIYLLLKHGLVLEPFTGHITQQNHRLSMPMT